MLWFKKKEERAEENTQVVGNTISTEDPVFRSLLGGDTVTRDMALQVPTVSGGIDLIANIIASTPIRLYMDVDGKAKEVTGDRRVRLLNEDPGDTLTANEFWRAIVEDYYVGKGGYAYINWNLNDIESLHYVREQDIAIIRSYDPIFKDYDILVNGVRYAPYKFFRILRNTKDGAEGIPITQESSKLISVAYNSLVFELNMSKRGGTKRGFLRSEKKLDNDALAALRTAFRKLYNGSSEDSFVLLNNGIDFKESSATGAEMQLNENKVTNAEEFSKIFHISTKTMSGTATDADTASLARLAAIPLMKAITSALNRDLLLEKEKDTYYFAFDTKELLKGDMKSRFDAYKVALDTNFMQIDEVRYMEDLEELGINWIKLGLQDVLYDPASGEIFTPNTGVMTSLGKMPLNQPTENGKIEPRANYRHDPKTGRFMEAPNKNYTLMDGGAFDEAETGRLKKGGGTSNVKAAKGGGSKKKKTKYAPTNSGKQEVGVKMSKKKYTQLSGKVATAHPEWISGIHVFHDANYGYKLEAHSFGNYTFQTKWRLK